MSLEETEALLADPIDARTRFTNSQFRVILACLFSLCFLSSADSTMVTTLMGKMASDLNSQTHISWVASSYLLSCATFQPLFGKLSDVFGRKCMILICISLFSVGCLICGCSGSLELLVIGRFITGIGGGGLSSLTTIAMSDMVSMRDRGLYGGYIGVFLDLGAISGGLLSGLVDKLWGWKYAFLGQVPICIMIAAAIYIWFDVPKQETNELSHWQRFVGIDWIGSFILVTSFFSLLMVTGTNKDDISDFIWWGLLGYCIFGFILLYIYEDNIENPVIPVRLLHNRTIFVTCINWWFMCMNFYTYVFYLPFYWTSVQNRSPLQSGYLFIPSTVISSFTALFAGWMLKHTGKYKLFHLVAGLFIAVGSVIVYTITPSSGQIWESMFSLPLRFGTTSNHTIMLIAMLSSVPQSQQALVTSIQYGFKSCGSTMGVAISNAIMQFQLQRSMDEVLKTVDTPNGWTRDEVVSIFSKALKDPGVAFQSELPSLLKKAIVNCYDQAGHMVFQFLILTALGCLAMIGLTRENSLNRKSGTAVGA